MHCFICQIIFKITDRSVVIPCSHVFHRHCLLKWMKNSKTCPQCKKRVDNDKILELDTNFPSTSNDPSDYPCNFENDLQVLKANFKKMNLKSIQEKITELQSHVAEMEKVVDPVFLTETSLTSQRMHTLANLKANMEKLLRENRDLHQEIENLNDAKTFLSYCQDDAENILRENKGEKYVKIEKSLPYRMASYCSAVNRRRESEKKIVQELNEELSDLKKRLDVTEQNIDHVESINEGYDSLIKTTRSNIARLLDQNLSVIPISAKHDDFASDPNEYPDPALGINYQASGKKIVEIAVLDPDMDELLYENEQGCDQEDKSNSVLGYINSDGHISVIVGPKRYENGSIPKMRFILK